jgi:protein with PEP-CTERM/exosortase system signal
MFYAAKSDIKALPKKLLPLILFGIAVTSLFSVQPAQAYTVTLQQVGSNVVANGSGAINLTGLALFVPLAGQAEVNPSAGFIITGPASLVTEDTYVGFLGVGPNVFGNGFSTLANSGSGDMVGLAFVGIPSIVIVPSGYISGTALSDSSTYDNATFASLGVTPGTYVWTWGAGANQNFTLQIGAAGVPDGGSTVSLLGCAFIGLAALRRKLSC